MNISPEDITTLEKLSGEQGARGTLSRVMLSILAEFDRLEERQAAYLRNAEYYPDTDVSKE